MTTRPQPSHLGASTARSWPQDARANRRMLAWLAVLVLAAHLALLGGMTGRLDWRLQTPDTLRVAPMQTRWVPPAVVPAASPAKPHAAPARTRLATVPAAPAVPALKPVPQAAPEVPPSPSVALPASAALDTRSTTPAPAERHSDTLSEAAPAPEPTPEPTPAPLASPPPQEVPVTAAALPPIPLGALPPSVLLRYKLTGQEKGLNYFANGELRWQHNEAAYTLGLSVKAFLVGSRHWRSVGEITPAGLAPQRFSDSWRNERAAHFDRVNQRMVFSNNAPTAPLEAGAQDQISLYVQLAAAMAGAPQRFEPGTRLQIQTATVKDALPWLLTLGANETLQWNGLSVSTAKWVCQPRNRFDATVEFWVSAQHAWMPVRIRITQVNGNYIDLMLSGQEALPPLPAQAASATAQPAPDS